MGSSKYPNENEYDKFLAAVCSYHSVLGLSWASD